MFILPLEKSEPLFEKICQIKLHSKQREIIDKLHHYCLLTSECIGNMWRNDHPDNPDPHIHDKYTDFFNQLMNELQAHHHTINTIVPEFNPLLTLLMTWYDEIYSEGKAQAPSPAHFYKFHMNLISAVCQYQSLWCMRLMKESTYDQ